MKKNYFCWYYWCCQSTVRLFWDWREDLTCSSSSHQPSFFNTTTFNNFSVFHLYHRKLWAKKYTTMCLFVLLNKTKINIHQVSLMIVPGISYCYMIMDRQDLRRKININKHQHQGSVSDDQAPGTDWSVLMFVV